jgi:hypothetical protein
MKKSKYRFTDILICGLILLILFVVSCSSDKSKQVTYAENIAPLVYKHCSTCHRPGSAGTFNLLTYEDVRKHAKQIELVTRMHVMPPWPADFNYVHYAGENYLTEEEIKLVKTWVDNDAPQGDKKKTPSPPVFIEGSMLGKPDMVVKMSAPFPISGNNKDRFMMMKLPVELERDTFLKAIEIVPGNTKVVHHINAHLVQYTPEKKKDINGGEKCVDTEMMDKREAFTRLDLPNDDGSYPVLTPSVTNYLPGVVASIYPRGIGGYHLSRKSVLLLDNIHYGPSPIDTSDQTTFNFFFMPSPPKRPTHEFIVGTSGISPVEPPLVVHPNTVQKFKSQYTLPEDLSLLTVNPHMHLLGKSFLAYAIKPGGDTVRLVRINNWDFRWQYFYNFEKMICLPKGSTIYAEGTYDNTASNPNNPFDPPRVVSERNGSMRTTDEMFQLIVTYIPYYPGDENISLINKSKQ